MNGTNVYTQSPHLDVQRARELTHERLRRRVTRRERGRDESCDAAREHDASRRIARYHPFEV